MNRPDKAGEPSMEEILASIRQIIADDSRAEQPEPAIEANPLVPQARAPRSPEVPLPLADRLSGVLKAGPLTPTSPFGSKRPLSFDQDLADMFDEDDASNGNAVSTPKPDIRVPAGLSQPAAHPHPMASKSFVPSKPESAEPALDGAAASSPQPAPSETLAPPPPKAFGFPPLRKTSFYPPQPRAASVASEPPQADALASARVPEPTATATPSSTTNDSPGGATPAYVADALKRLEGLGPVASAAGEAIAVAPEVASPQPRPPINGFATPVETPTSGFGLRGAEPAQRDAPVTPSRPFGGSSSFAALSQFSSPSSSPFGSSSPFSSPQPAPAQPGPERVSSHSPFTGPQALGADTNTPFEAAPRVESPVAPAPIESRPFEGRPFEARPFEERPVEARSHPDPFAQSVRAAPGYTERPRFTAEPVISSAAAHQALDALAMGLAASAAGSSGHPEPVAPAIPLTPVYEVPEPEPPRAAPQPSVSMLPAMLSSPGSMPVTRTLEDAVADMLRPMLQQWVADNMPRIIERALRTEVAKSTKPGQKPGG